MPERFKLYYSSKIDNPWCDLNLIQSQLQKLQAAGIEVAMIDTASMSEQEIYEHYIGEAIYPSVRKQYRIRQLFGTQKKSGNFFGRQQPALLVYEGDSRHPIDVYPRDESGKRVSIEDILAQKIKEMRT